VDPVQSGELVQVDDFELLLHFGHDGRDIAGRAGLLIRRYPRTHVNQSMIAGNAVQLCSSPG